MLLPVLDRNTVQPTEGGKEGTEEQQRMVPRHTCRATARLIPSGQCRRSGKQQCDSNLLWKVWKRFAAGPRRQMHQLQIEKAENAKNAVGEKERTRHLRDEHGQNQGN